jgi:TM2 domain-containing membrane protein YozV
MHPAGWFVDPSDARQLRYWDGQSWTGYTQPRTPGAPVPGGTPYPGGYGYPAGPPMAVAAKNPAVSLLVSFFIPGVGSMINGDTGTGIVILVIWLISFPLMFVFIGFFTLIGAFIWGLVDAYQGARRWNARHGIIS